MIVTLIACTPDAEQICSTGAKVCYSADMPDIKLYSKILTDAVESGHESVLEHAVFTFSIEGISRVTTHQLVRHRIGASHSQQSGRYVKGMPDYVLPKSIISAMNDEAVVQALREWESSTKKAIRLLEDAKVPQEDIRYLYPFGIKSNIITTMNARELLHFFSLRCCDRSQWEIRELANKMLVLCKEQCPIIFNNAGPPCINGKCREKNPCKKKVNI